MIKVTILVLILNLPAVVLAESFDLNQLNDCDELFCVESSQADTISREIEEQNGIIFPNQARGRLVQPQIIQINNGNITVQPSPSRQNIMPELNITNETGEKLETSSISKGQSLSGKQASLQQSNITSHNAPINGYSNNNPNLKAGGFLYSDDDETPAKIGVDNSIKTGTALSHLNPGINAVELNKKTNENLSTSNEKQSASFSPNTLGGFGNFESANGQLQTKKGLVTQVKDGLSKIAKSLGENFFGLSGKKGKNSRRRLNSLKKIGKNGLKKKGADKANLSKSQLKLSLSKYQNRGLASKLEFGSARSFIFGNVCKHYEVYARNNNIPNDRARCPQN